MTFHYLGTIKIHFFLIENQFRSKAYGNYKSFIEVSLMNYNLSSIYNYN